MRSMKHARRRLVIMNQDHESDLKRDRNILRDSLNGALRQLRLILNSFGTLKRYILQLGRSLSLLGYWKMKIKMIVISNNLAGN